MFHHGTGWFGGLLEQIQPAEVGGQWLFLQKEKKAFAALEG